MEPVTKKLLDPVRKHDLFISKIEFPRMCCQFLSRLGIKEIHFETLDKFIRSFDLLEF